MALLACAISHAGWVAKINSVEISLEEFQRYVNFQKQRSDSDINKLSDIEIKKGLLKKYIETKIILIEAKKVGYTKGHAEIKKFFEKNRKSWIAQDFLLSKIDQSKINVSEAKVKGYFRDYRDRIPDLNSSATYENIDPKLRQQLYQAVYAEELKKLKDEYQAQLEKKYKIKRYKLEKYIVAVVNKEKIKRTSLIARLDEEIRAVGNDPERIKKEKKEYDKLLNSVRDTMILEILLQEEIKRINYDKKQRVRDSLKVHVDELIYNYYILHQIFDKVEVTDSERSALYNQLRDRLESLKYEEINAYLNQTIKRQKGQIVLQNFITERKEESIIKRNYKELEKLR